MRFRFSFLAASLLAFGCSDPAVQESAEQDFITPAKKPNIIFILADDLGYGDLGSYGQTKIKTPNIDQLAENGIRFTQHYAGSSVCGPSRASLLTGLDTGHSNIRTNPAFSASGLAPELGEQDVTVADVLKDAGYQTAIIGKWAMADRKEMNLAAMPNQQGFDYFFGLKTHGDGHHYYWPTVYRNNEKLHIDGNKWRELEGQYNHDLFTQEALEYVERVDKDKPFFLYLSYTIPHKEITVPEDSKEQYLNLGWEERPMKKGHYIHDPEGNTTYAGMVSRMDRDIGWLVESIEKQGLADNTLIIFTSDNGHEYDNGFFDSNGPLKGSKRALYEGGIRIPFIAYWPNTIAPGQTSDHISAFWDFMPTACELAGVDQCAQTNGISYVSAMLGDTQTQPEHDYLYWEYNDNNGPKQAVRKGDWKLVSRYQKAPELYNLVDDIGETTNVAEQHPQVLSQLLALMQSARTSNPEFPLTKR